MTTTPPGQRTLLVAATGGHLEQLVRLRERLMPETQDVEWATFDEPQSRSLLAGQKVHHVTYVPPRGYRAALDNVAKARTVLKEGHFDRVVSTGSGVAIPFMAAARFMRVPCHYIESAARTEGPSLTGRVVSTFPGVRLYSQYQTWANRRWQYRGSLFDSFQPDQIEHSGQAARVVVTLGTMRTYGFRRAVDACLALLPQVTTPDAEILWQVGHTETGDLPIEAHRTIPQAQMAEAIADADLVIAHAGIGSALTALEAGKCPVLLPRSAAKGEHIDNHQLLIAGQLNTRGLAVVTDPDALTTDHLLKAMRTSVKAAAASAEPFVLTP